MDDTIYRQATIDAVLDRMDVGKHGRDAKREEIQWTLEKLPSAQPEIIRCAKCKYSCIDEERESDEVYCSEMDFYPSDDFFCGYAKRKEN